MTAADKHLYDTDLLDVLSQRVMVGDGAMGTQLQAADLTLDDFRGLEGCNEILNETRPDVLETIHRNYFEAGADAVETNTFGCNLSNLGDYDIADRIRDLSQKGTAIARRVADELGSPDRKRYVLGSMGPGTKLPTLGHTEYAVIRDAYTEAALGMLDGGADAILVETCQDLLQLKAAVLGSRRAMTRAGRHIPVFAHVTVETTGTMLLGSEIGAALTAVEPLGVDMIGLNCATGPAEMSEHLRHLSRHARIPVSVMPNAGLPVLGAKGAEYPLLPDELAEALAGFIAEFGLSLVGGCCGTTPAHIREVAAAVANIKRPERQVSYEPSVSSLYTAIPFAQDASVLVIGERTNANGSKGFREAMIAEDYQKCLDIAKDQTRDGAHAIKAREKEAERKARHQRSKRIAAQRKAAEEPVEVPERSDVAADIEVPAPPFWGSRIVKGLAVADYTGLLDERALFLGQWGLRGQRGGEGPSYEDLVETEGRPRLRYWLDRLSTDGILAHAAVVYGYFPAVSEGNDIVVLTEPKPDAPVRYRFHFPRQQRGRFLCIADFIRSRELAAERGEVDVLPFQLVTMGQPIADFANELFASNAYRDYLEVHGIGVQLTEALAEYWHRRIREELKFSGDRAMAAEDPEAKEDYFKLGYRGARFAFGYGACPDLEDRAKMMALLEPERIGVTLSEELQLHPEQSTDAFVLHHPEAKYFNV